ncbi:hypothetical protein R3P38DRAFT_3184621 [Favolaschia claudopus]|uniref:Uncharacterized protein n=1 Tax=Favolaschia claudopus TaxID=2862362 RepID=A0AAW0C829_9AGAR
MVSKSNHSGLLALLNDHFDVEEGNHANLERAIRRCNVNALKSIFPDFEKHENNTPQASVDAGGGYMLLCAQDSCARRVSVPEEEAIREYLQDEFGSDVSEGWRPFVVRWARAKLPDGQIVRSSWKEEDMTVLRAARHVKVQLEGEDNPRFAEILFFMILCVDEEERYVGVASFFGPPEEHLLKLSSSMYWSFQHLRDADIRVIELTSIISCVTMAPDSQYQTHRTDGSHTDRWFLMQEPGAKLASWTGRNTAEQDR